MSIEAEGQLHPEAINMWLQDLMMERGADIFRSKGVLSLAGTDDKCAVPKCARVSVLRCATSVV